MPVGGKRDRIRQWRERATPRHLTAALVSRSKAPSAESQTAPGEHSDSVHVAEEGSLNSIADECAASEQANQLPNLWAEAFRRVEQSNPQVVTRLRGRVPPNIRPEYQQSSLLEELCNSARCFQNYTTIYVTSKGRVISMGQISDNIIKWLNKFKEVGDIAVNYDPAHPALPWAAFRFILTALAIHSQHREEILIGLEQVLLACFRCRNSELQYEVLLEKTAIGQELTESIIGLYETTLDFIDAALRFNDQGSTKSALRGVFSPDLFREKLANIRTGEKSASRRRHSHASEHCSISHVSKQVNYGRECSGKREARFSGGHPTSLMRMTSRLYENPGTMELAPVVTEPRNFQRLEE